MRLVKTHLSQQITFAVGHGVSVHAEHAGVTSCQIRQNRGSPKYEVAATETPGMSQVDRGHEDIQNNDWMDMKASQWAQPA